LGWKWDRLLFWGQQSSLNHNEWTNRRNRRLYSKCNTYTNANCHADTHTDSDSNSNANPDSGSNSNSNPDSDSNANPNSNSNPDADSNSDSNRHADANTNANICGTKQPYSHRGIVE
jgi:hypothetical protein